MSKPFAAFVGVVIGCIHGVVAYGANLTFSSVPIWTHAVVVEKVIMVLAIIDVSMLLIVLTSGWWCERAVNYMEQLAAECEYDEDE